MRRQAVKIVFDDGTYMYVKEYKWYTSLKSNDNKFALMSTTKLNEAEKMKVFGILSSVDNSNNLHKDNKGARPLK